MQTDRTVSVGFIHMRRHFARAGRKLRVRTRVSSLRLRLRGIQCGRVGEWRTWMRSLIMSRGEDSHAAIAPALAEQLRNTPQKTRQRTPV